MGERTLNRKCLLSEYQMSHPDCREARRAVSRQRHASHVENGAT